MASSLPPIRVINRGSNVNIIPTIPRVPVRRVEHSLFFITISTNLRPTTNEESHAIKDRLDIGIRNMLSPENFAGCIVFLTPGESVEDKLIKNVRAEFSIELGRKIKGGRIHAHILIDIDHYAHVVDKRGGIRLSREKINAAVREGGGFRSLYCNIKAAYGTKYLLDYIKKDQDAITSLLDTMQI